MAVILVQGQRLSSRLAANEQKTVELQQQIESENQRTEDIDNMQEYMQSDEYAKQVAREKLGLVEGDEIIFKEK